MLPGTACQHMPGAVAPAMEEQKERVLVCGVEVLLGAPG